MCAGWYFTGMWGSIILVKVWTHKTSLLTCLLQTRKINGNDMSKVFILPICAILLLDYGTVPTLVFCVFHLSIYSRIQLSNTISILDDFRVI